MNIKNTIIAWGTAFVIGLLGISCSEPYESPLSGQTVKDVIYGPALSAYRISIGHGDLTNIKAVSSANWITTNVQKQYLTLNVQENNTYGERKATITLTDPEDGTLLSFKVTQEQNNAILTDSATYHVAEKGGTILVKVESNVKYQVEIPSDIEWLKKAEAKANTRALESSSFTLEADKNNSGDVRQAVVKVTDKNTGTISEFTVEQALTPYLEVETAEHLFFEDGGEFEIPVKTNIQVNVKPDADWITCGETVGADDLNFVQLFKIAPMEGRGSREATITFSDKLGKWKLQKTIPVRQTKSMYLISRDTIMYVKAAYDISYVNNTAESLNWESSNPSVAKVDDHGHVTCLKGGKTIIRAISSNEKYKDSLTVEAVEVTPMFESYCRVSRGTIRLDGDEFYGNIAHCKFVNNSIRDVVLKKCTLYRGGSVYTWKNYDKVIKPDFWESFYVEGVSLNSTWRCEWDFEFNGIIYTVSSN